MWSTEEGADVMNRIAAQMSSLPPFDGGYRAVKRELRQAALIG